MKGSVSLHLSPFIIQEPFVRGRAVSALRRDERSLTGNAFLDSEFSRKSSYYYICYLRVGLKEMEYFFSIFLKNIKNNQDETTKLHKICMTKYNMYYNIICRRKVR